MSETYIKGAAVKVNASMGSPAAQTVIAAQKGGGIKIKADRLETTNKDGNGWKTFLGGNKEWSIDFDGLVLSTNATQAFLRTAIMNGTEVSVEVQGIDGPASGSPATPSKLYGTASVEELSWDFSDTEAVKFKCTLVGSSSLSFTAAGS